MKKQAQKDTHMKSSELSLCAWMPGAHLSESEEVHAGNNIAAGLYGPCS